MASSSFVYCSFCGAANQPQATQCFACSQSLEASVEDTALPSPAEPPVAPALLAGRYRILDIVGKGGFGAVYKAVDMQRRGLLVAIKEINLRGLHPRDVIEATDTFNREMLLLSDLQHANLPHIHDHFTDAEHWYLAMDFIEGETLDEYLSNVRRGHLSVEEVLYIGIQLCTVLDYLHTRQPPIIFRDVKPANVMRTANGHLYLIDFGIARRFTPGQKRDTTVLGSPGYAPPEQYGKAQTTVQSDIYSLGATLRCLLTGNDPSESTFGYTSSPVQDREVPANLERLLVQMVELDASKRPASMDTVKRALQGIKYEQELLRPGSLPPRVLAARQPPQSAGYAIQQTPFSVGAGGQMLQPPSQRGISRRAAIISLVGLAGLATVGTIWGGLALSALSQQSPSQAPTQGAQSPQVTSVSQPLYTYTGHSDTVDALAWSPDGKRIASGSVDQTVQVWDATTGKKLLTYRGHSDTVDALAWSPDGQRIASGSYDDTVQVWDATTGKKLLTYGGHSSPVYALTWSPDGQRIASGSVDKTMQVWDASTGGNMLTYRGHSDTVDALAWSPDGRYIASGSYDDTVQVWNAATGKKLLTYTGHTAAVDAVSWSPNGKYIASGSWDKTVQVWKAP